MRIPKTSSKWGFMGAYAVLALTLVGSGFAMNTVIGLKPPPPGPPAPKIERKTCDGTPYNTKKFDASGASQVLYSFIYDNVFRMNLDRGYRLTTDALRAGGNTESDQAPLSKVEWLTGDIPVPYENPETGTACTIGADLKKNKWTAAFLIGKNSYLGEIIFVGGRWLVDYFAVFTPQQTPSN